MLVMPAIAETFAAAARPSAALSPDTLGQLAARALREEAVLTPKPGLVDLRGGNAHPDMDVAILLASADALADPIARCAEAARFTPPGPQLRARIGTIGRAGEQRMLHATHGVNSHRGALWVLGLLAAGLAVHPDPASAATFAARLASIPDPALAVPTLSHGALARRRYGATGALGEACAGFPHAMHIALPALRSARAAAGDEDTARLAALLSCMASLEDTCTLHRGGPEGLAIVRDGAHAAVLAGGGATTCGRQLLGELDVVTRRLRLSTGGSGDVLAAALFIDSAHTLVGAGGED
jgi:triphosphoribosyl-dephospho-CoA synthase